MEHDILGILADLEYVLGNGKKVPFTNQYIVDRDVIFQLAQQLRDALPEGIKEADEILKQESRILSDAQRTAENVCAEADSRAKALRMDSEQRANAVTEKARKESEDLLASSHAQAQEIIDNAERRQAELVSQTEIFTRAEQQANEILTNARSESQRMRMMVMDHCRELLKQAEDGAIQVANELREARLQFDQNL